MSRYTVYITPAAWQEVKSLPGHIRQRVRRAIDALADMPRPPSSKALEAPNLPHELRRVRLDRWRIVYAITEADLTIDVLAVRKRPPYDYGDLGKMLESLDQSLL